MRNLRSESLRQVTIMSQHQDSEGVFQSIFGDEPLELLLKPAPPSPKRPRTLPLNAPGVYILRLSGCRFYVGRSEDVTKRVQAHWEGQGSTWTRRHKVLGVEHVLPQSEGTTLEKLELVTTIEQMKKRGIHRVRGSCLPVPFTHARPTPASQQSCPPARLAMRPRLA